MSAYPSVGHEERSLPHIRLQTEAITDWPSFHAECRRALGFPDFYGANMNAWIDCMSCLEDDDGMVGIRLGPGELLLLEIPDSTALNARVPEIVNALVECTAFVNQQRYAEPRIALLLS